MAIRVFKPTSPGRRNCSSSDFREITNSEPLKKLLESKTSTGGRNNNGRITSRFRGGGNDKAVSGKPFQQRIYQWPCGIRFPD